MWDLITDIPFSQALSQGEYGGMKTVAFENTYMVLRTSSTLWIEALSRTIEVLLWSNTSSSNRCSRNSSKKSLKTWESTVPRTHLTPSSPILESAKMKDKFEGEFPVYTGILSPHKDHHLGLLLLRFMLNSSMKITLNQSLSIFVRRERQLIVDSFWFCFLA